ncbi:M1 family aminopeptidase [Pontibacter burrus]|uniref:Aminopeptidase N n=1 Tax=Pontibacter burrus TaxID=2704466 RepID=A0A6B3LT94_9BACT|nr:M1 family aminopeptidase [Pontibacter burrus]NEM96701.1 T9SS type A sorting domain-containing protein [Pontibacter burrus]
MKILLQLLFFLLVVLQYDQAVAQLQAQEQYNCAQSHLQQQTRTAVASPEHQQLMNLYDVTFYGLDLKLERNSVYIEGSVTIAAIVKGNPLQVFAFELHPNFTIQGVTIDGAPQQNISRNSSDVRVQLNTPTAAHRAIQVVINYRGTAPNGGNAAIGNGFNTARLDNWNTDVTWSLSEPYAAYEWWPTKQVLTDKADSVDVTITTSAENRAGSNGVLTNTTLLPNGKVAYHWKSRYPIAYYLISVAVSDYDEYVQIATIPGKSEQVPIVNYIYKGALPVFKPEIDLTASFMAHFSELFSPYPFATEKYGHSMAPIGGGMEHQTMTTQSTFTTTLTAHELAHQWFGDNVTCATWQDIWLNEGFASYAEYLALQQISTLKAETWMNDAHGRAKTAMKGSLRVPDTTDVSRIFNYNLTYKKGAAVVHMLRHEINNDALFFQALRNYQAKFSGKTATTADLQQVMEETTGKDLGYFFRQWYEGEGYPLFSLQWNQIGKKLILKLQQSATGNTPFFRTDVTFQFQTSNGLQSVRVTQEQPVQYFVFEVAETFTSIEIDPANYILKEVRQIIKDPNLQQPETKPIVYPNPVSTNSITITDIPFAATEVIIFDRIGRKVSTNKLGGQATIPLEITTLPAGLYFVRLSDGRSTATTSFLKL